MQRVTARQSFQEEKFLWIKWWAAVTAVHTASNTTLCLSVPLKWLLIIKRCDIQKRLYTCFNSNILPAFTGSKLHICLLKSQCVIGQPYHCNFFCSFFFLHRCWPNSSSVKCLLVKLHFQSAAHPHCPLPTAAASDSLSITMPAEKTKAALQTLRFFRSSLSLRAIVDVCRARETKRLCVRGRESEDTPFSCSVSTHPISVSTEAPVLSHSSTVSSLISSRCRWTRALRGLVFVNKILWLKRKVFIFTPERCRRRSHANKL